MRIASSRNSRPGPSRPIPKDRSDRRNLISRSASRGAAGFDRVRTRRYPSESHHRRLCQSRESADGSQGGGGFMNENHGVLASSPLRPVAPTGIGHPQAALPTGLRRRWVEVEVDHFSAVVDEERLLYLGPRPPSRRRRLPLMEASSCHCPKWRSPRSWSNRDRTCADRKVVAPGINTLRVQRDGSGHASRSEMSPTSTSSPVSCCHTNVESSSRSPSRRRTR